LLRSNYKGHVLRAPRAFNYSVMRCQ